MKKIITLVILLIFSALIINFVYVQEDKKNAMKSEEREVEDQDAFPIPHIEIYRNLDSKYHKITGSQDHTSFSLHYCLPGFIPRGLGDCNQGVIPGADPFGVQVQYRYALNRSDKRPYLEGSRGLFPFPVNTDVDGKTPYVKFYKERDEYVKQPSNKLVLCENDKKQEFEGLVCYVTEKKPSIEHWWVPENIDEYKTKLGNPPIFVCGSTYCVLVLDQGDGWGVLARFNEAALENWQQFYVDLNRSISDLIKEAE